jgi:uncharacterized protein YbjT (DUF2867 family)
MNDDRPKNAAPRIVVAGASGYVGMALIQQLLDRFPEARITAIARRVRRSDDPRVEWRACDLFSLRSLEAALPAQVDAAIYLVHSMGPTAHLDQGSFADYDLILADNFARAIGATGVRHVIYLGGLIPRTGNLSPHLRSRLEVEETFINHGLPLTVFRAGLILGESGSSFQILLKLVNRLPFMVCPRWTQTLTSPVDLPRVLWSIADACLQEPHIGRTYDLAGCLPLSYVDMMRGTAMKAGKKRRFVTVPFFTPTLSRLWVSLITRASRNLVYPLIESLEHPMTARAEHAYPGLSLASSFADLLEGVPMRTVPGPGMFRFQADSGTVRSVQRLPLPEGADARWVLEQYLGWLPRHLSPLINVRRDGQRVRFSVLAARPVLLEMDVSKSRSSTDRVLLYIVGGWLVSGAEPGRLEFRITRDHRFVLAAIHNFRPALPWFLYTLTQARLHVMVMNAFARYLAKCARTGL